MKNRISPNAIAYFLFVHLCLLFSAAFAQEKNVTLILRGKDEIPCEVTRIAHGYVYFKAATKNLAFKYGDYIEVEKIAGVRLRDGKILNIEDFMEQRRGAEPPAGPVEAPPTPKPLGPPQREPKPQQTPASSLPPPPSGPGIRVTRQNTDTPQTPTGIGLRLPEMPPSPPETELNYTELANMLAEAALAGKLLNEINSGNLTGRRWTKSQKELLDAIAQSPVWLTRKNALREAQRMAESEFNTLTFRNSILLAYEFQFRPTASKHAFLEFMQFLHLENAPHFQDQWKKVEANFGADAAVAIRDILNNYDDWFFLFGEPLEKQ